MSLFNNFQIASDFVNLRTKPPETLLQSRGQKTVRWASIELAGNDHTMTGVNYIHSARKP